MRARWTVGLAIAAAAGCANLERRESEPVRFLAADFHSHAASPLAVLPFDNESTDLVAAETLRSFVTQQLSSMGYAPLSAEPVDEALRAIGITEGGQLRPVAPAEVGKVVGAVGLLYGVIEEFAFLNVGFAVRRVVRVRLKLVEARTGESLWEDTGQGLTERWTLNKKDAGLAFMEGLLERAIEGVFRTPLQPEAREAVRQACLRLPPRAGLY